MVSGPFNAARRLRPITLIRNLTGGDANQPEMEWDEAMGARFDDGSCRYV